MTHYQQTISKITGIADPAILVELEEIMRLEYRTLDHLSPQKFRAEAKLALKVYEFEQSDEGKAHAAQLDAAMLNFDIDAYIAANS